MHIEALTYNGIGVPTLAPSFFLVSLKLLGILCDSLDSLIVGNMHHGIFVIFLFSSECLSPCYTDNKQNKASSHLEGIMDISVDSVS